MGSVTGQMHTVQPSGSIVLAQGVGQSINNEHSGASTFLVGSAGGFVLFLRRTGELLGGAGFSVQRHKGQPLLSISNRQSKGHSSTLAQFGRGGGVVVTLKNRQSQMTQPASSVLAGHSSGHVTSRQSNGSNLQSHTGHLFSFKVAKQCSKHGKLTGHGLDERLLRTVTVGAVVVLSGKVSSHSHVKQSLALRRSWHGDAHDGAGGQI